jgi:hypothetical protein
MPMMPYVSMSPQAYGTDPMLMLGQQDNMLLPSVSTLAASTAIPGFRPFDSSAGLIGILEDNSLGQQISAERASMDADLSSAQKRSLLPLPSLGPSSRLFSPEGMVPSFGLLGGMSPLLPSPAQLGIPQQRRHLPQQLMGQGIDNINAVPTTSLGIAGLSQAKMKKQRTEI